MKIRKENDRIYLGVFTLEAIQMLDRTFQIFFLHAMNHSLVEDEREKCFKLHYLRISDYGEGYVMLNVPELANSEDAKYCMWNFDEELIKTIVKSWYLYYSSFTALYSKPMNMSTNGKSGAYPDDQIKVANNFKKILNTWEGVATEEDEKFIGEPLDAFKQQILKEPLRMYNEVMKDYVSSRGFDDTKEGKTIADILK